MFQSYQWTQIAFAAALSFMFICRDWVIATVMDYENIMKYDDASWHYGGEFPEELESSAGATHIGMFLAWALLSDLGGELHTEDLSDDVAKLRDRTTTPGQYLINVCDEKLTDEDLSENGNAFARAYYEAEAGSVSFGVDYTEALADDVPTIYHVSDTWDCFDQLKPLMDKRFAEWKARN